MNRRLSPQQRRFLDALQRGPVHSHDARRTLGIGDPSRRAQDLRELGYDVRSKLSRRGKAHGVLYRLVGPVPAEAALPPGGGADLILCEPHGPAKLHRAPYALGAGASLVLCYLPDSRYYGKAYWLRKGAQAEPAQQELGVAA